MNQQDADRQRRGAYAAGYEDGFREGRESLYREGWEKITDYKSVKEGDIIKLMVQTIFGWKGEARVNYATPTGINAHRLDRLDDETEMVDCCLHECLVLRAKDA